MHKKEFLPWEELTKLSDEEIELRKRKFETLDYYGIPYGVIDDSKTEETKKDLDYLRASVLIGKGMELPEDLKERLLKYKEEN